MLRAVQQDATGLRPPRGRYRIALLFAVVVALLLLAGSEVAAGSAPAQIARSCSTPRYPGSGYFTSLTVRHTSCATGRKVALAYYRCRTRSGRAGRCHKRVLGYRCRERRNTIPTEIDARVTCRRGAKTVVHTYQQNT